MTTNEIKKEISKQKPIAELTEAKQDGTFVYTATLEDGTVVRFEVPYEDTFIGGVDEVMKELEPSVYLLKYLKN